MGEEKITKTAVKAEAVPPKTVDKVVIEKKTAKKSAKDAPKVTYDENSILHLEGLEHIRLRPGMYIGSLGDGTNENDGIYILLKEGIDNSVDEYSQGYGDKIDIEIKDGRVKIRDYGRGIPLGKLEQCICSLNTYTVHTDCLLKYRVVVFCTGVNVTYTLFKLSKRNSTAIIANLYASVLYFNVNLIAIALRVFID